MTETNHAGLIRLGHGDRMLTDPAEDVRGLTVVDLYRHRVGEVDGLVVDEPHGRTRLLVVGSGGIMGLVRTRRLVPVEIVAGVDEVVHLDASREKVHEADFDLDLDLVRAYLQACAHYGVAPFWSSPSDR